MTEDTRTGFGSWAHIELMGHRSHWGFVSEEVIAGAAFLRVDVFAIGDEVTRGTFFYPPTSVYGITPCAEEKARLASTPYADRPRAALDPAVEDDDEDDDEDEPF